MWNWIGLLGGLFGTAVGFYYMGAQHWKELYEDAARELMLIDEALARRPALNDYPNRYSKVSRACFMAGEHEKGLNVKSGT